MHPASNSVNKFFDRLCSSWTINGDLELPSGSAQITRPPRKLVDFSSRMVEYSELTSCWLLNRNSVDHRTLLEHLGSVVPFLVNGAEGQPRADHALAK
jgi:hypothetical protein